MINRHVNINTSLGTNLIHAEEVAVVAVPACDGSYTRNRSQECGAVQGK